MFVPWLQRNQTFQLDRQLHTPSESRTQPGNHTGAITPFSEGAGRTGIECPNYQNHP